MLILPVAALWGALYLALGLSVGVVPLVYFAVLLGAIVVFAGTRDFPWLIRPAARWYVADVAVFLRTPPPADVGAS